MSSGAWKNVIRWSSKWSLSSHKNVKWYHENWIVDRQTNQPNKYSFPLGGINLFLIFFFFLFLNRLMMSLSKISLYTLCLVFLCVTSVDLVSRRVRQQRRQQLLLMHLHLLANPGDSLLLQHTLDRLLRWLCPSLRIFHVSERASPFRTYPRLCPVAGKDPGFSVCSPAFQHSM